ncbi:MAG: hypothetical protein LC135_11940 [Phycisphaerae bacterium]|nr:hypothetical protein [Phycisphaerae bacterium]MCZ2400560.1 hypothetical protein [Phycisphaerae bacterium]NUQ50934.1 hypothetical protein [Phycisphaerae bacterium]
MSQATTLTPRPTAEPTDFQRRLVTHADAAVEWLARSIAACGGRGSAAYYSRWYRPARGWAPPYPETTGYIIETLIAHADFARRPELIELALSQADWIRTLQEDDGALPGGWIAGGRKPPPSIFNTGQMILGLVAAGDRSGDAACLESARRAASWLAGQVDSATGTWMAHSYVAGYSPAYYTRVAWPVLEVWRRTGDSALKSAAVRVLDTIAGWQQPNGAIRNWEFRPGQPAFTHTMAYTIRGFLESARLLGNEGDRFFDVALRAADAVRRRMELRGRLAGAYDAELRGRYWYTCLTGNCQFAIAWMKLGDRTRDARFLSAALKALEFVTRRQSLGAIDPNVRGAIAGSSPLWGRYLTLRYPNWAAKFFVDACHAAHARLQRLVEDGPCGS